jgi:hypothetical protein
VLPQTISVDPDYLRPYTDEYTGGVDHELFPSLRLSAIYTHRLERNPQATSNPANPYDTFLTTRVDTGRDGVAGTADDSTFQFYNRNSTVVNQTFFSPTTAAIGKRMTVSRSAAPSACRTVGRCWPAMVAEPGRRLERQHQPEQPDQRAVRWPDRTPASTGRSAIGHTSSS